MRTEVEFLNWMTRREINVFFRLIFPSLLLNTTITCLKKYFPTLFIAYPRRFKNKSLPWLQRYLLTFLLIVFFNQLQHTLIVTYPNRFLHLISIQIRHAHRMFLIWTTKCELNMYILRRRRRGGVIKEYSETRWELEYLGG